MSNTHDLPVGSWLINDPDDKPYDWAVFRRVHSFDPGESVSIVIDWSGRPDHADRVNAGFDPDIQERMVFRRLTEEQLTALEMAAHHGTFAALARRMWETLA